MAIELATAYVSIVPSTKGIAGKLRGELGGPLSKVADESGKTAGRGFAANLATSAGRDLNRLGGGIVSGLGTAFRVGAAAVAAGIATSIGLGLRRLVGIEDAQAKMRGLGYTSAEVDVIMTNALDSVRGTAFGLADAAAVAAGTLAAGVKPGQELESVLKLVGDASTIAGADFNEMGAIFNKVGAANRLTMSEVNQLSERGIPIMQWLADEYGVTALEARKMVEQGEIDFQAFRSAIEENIGGAALESGNTTSGAFANMGAAAGRFGAALIGPVYNKARDFFNGVTDWLDNATDRIGPLATTVGEGLGAAFETVSGIVSGFVEGWKLGFDEIGQSVAATIGGPVRFGALARAAFDAVSEAVSTAIGWLRENEETIRTVAAAFGPAVGIVAGLAVTTNLLTRAWAILRAATPLGIVLALATGLVYAWQNSERFRAFVEGAARAVVRFRVPIAAVAALIVSTYIPAIVASRAAVVAATAAKAAAWVRGRIAAVSFFLFQIRYYGTLAVSAVSSAATQVGAWLYVQGQALATGAIIRAQAFVALVSGWARAGAAAVAGAATQAAAWLSTQTTAIASAVATRTTAVASVVMGWARMAAASLAGAAKVALAWMISLGPIALVIAAVVGLVVVIVKNWDTIREVVTRVARAVWDFVLRAWNAIRSGVTTAVNAVRNVVTGAFNAVRDAVTNAVNAVRDRATAAFNAVRDRIRTAVTAARTAVSGAFNAVRDAVTNAVNAVRDRATSGFNAVRDRMRDAVNNARDAVRTAFERIKTAVFDRVRDVLAKVRALPGDILSALGDLGSLLYDSGKKIIRGLIDGITDMAGNVKDAVGGVLTSARNMLPFSPAKEGPFSGRGWTLYAGRSIAEGLADGLDQRRRLVSTTTARLAADARASMSPILDGLEALDGSSFRSDARFAAPNVSAPDPEPIVVELNLAPDVRAVYRIERSAEGRTRALRQGGR